MRRAVARLLVVDDNAPVRRLMAEELRTAGFEVVAAGSLAEARALSGPFDALVLDIRLPNGDGRAVRSLWPQVPCLTISGAEDDVDLCKPFSMTTLIARVRLLLGVA